MRRQGLGVATETRPAHSLEQSSFGGTVMLGLIALVALSPKS